MLILVRHVVSCMFILSLIAFPASADTFTVDNTGDDPDANPGDGTCATSGGVCTLRAAIQEANATANSGGPDFIEFDISGPTPHVIQPLSRLPSVADPVFIKGDSEPDYAGTPVVVVDGQFQFGSGLTFDALSNQSLVQALSIINSNDGITLNGTDSVLIYNNYIGVASDGSAAGNSGIGIRLRQGASSTIGVGGGTGNVISNNFIGISINGGASDNVIKGNLIGVDPLGNIDMGNNSSGILAVNGAINITIGGPSAGERNVISGNGGRGVFIENGDATIEGNYIGINEDGDAAIANDQDGIELRFSAGGSVAVTDNVVSGNTEHGIELVNSGTQADITGNNIGTNAAGDAVLGNTLNGIEVANTASATIGGTAPGADNTVAGNGEYEIRLATDGNTVLGNFLDTNSNGDDLGSSFNALRIGGGNNQVALNVIGHTTTNAVSVNGSNNTLQANFIGVTPGGTDIGHTGSSIQILGSNNTIGGVGAGEGNTLANAGWGVALISTNTGNTVRGNTIYNQSQQGIDFDQDGVTPNDAGDSDDGPNSLQNFPEIQNADYVSGVNEVTVTYQVPSDPSLTGPGASVYPLTIDFYQADADGSGEAYLGTDTYSATDYNNGPDKQITFTPGASVTAADDLVATATDDNGNTSEFTEMSNPLPVELAGLEAQRSGSDAVMVQWQTLSETNNAGFEVQRRANSTWDAIATVEGAGTTDQPQSYRFEDADLPYAADSLSYRLRQIDTDGTAAFSEAVTIARTVQRAELLPAYPNPTRSTATVRFAVPDSGQDASGPSAVRITLYDMLGRRVRTVVDTDTEGRAEQVLDVSDLASGTYFLRMETEAGPVDTQRITVVR